ncbi:tRNA uridine-5-carboxymethylaminomethyl(34) synthesis GTPase MnmE [Qipengyuania sp. 6B39]|uniref:tRNA uridine-5-carboxymethylaminomethyl(34) synthesis GTPase MnmE n=1 Tax=Qipengyuania proteolytica TaxID=2867239 RepID=UPI001C89E5D5|nr:tRNA uridine-5-carboxymethylaminomethyl(34) synthesis GTPase MnmE [Qipengyuania proteolytica]MBX7494616.1 tRNA uridine-5-carboxymethylaminomethyl(34) synthesis GTPase MnmE [Qipengyuania proteolytica]
MDDTIFALSSGAPPAAIAIVRISGPHAGKALATLAGSLPEPRAPSLRKLRDEAQALLDEALVLWFPGPATATGEDLAELHCHGGRAVVTAVLAALDRLPGLREAEPGEFTRRAFANGRIDLAEAEGLADLLSAETEWQRRGALTAAGGILSQRIEAWRERLLGLSARIEAVIDFGDEDDVADIPADFAAQVGDLRAEMVRVLERPSADRLRDGVRVVFAGPPNAGKSSLFNALLEEGVAIVSAEAGTTRDVIERPVAIGGVPFVFVDTAGLREEGAGEIEAIGIGRAQEQLARADIVLWLGEAEERPEGALLVASKADLGTEGKGDHLVSAVTGQGLGALTDALVVRGKAALPPPDRVALNRRQKALAAEAATALEHAALVGDPLIVAEELRLARMALDSISGRNSTEDMLDALFGRFCIGK